MTKRISHAAAHAGLKMSMLPRQRPARLSLIAIAMIASPASAQSLQATRLAKALYWNTVPAGSLTDAQMDAAVAELKAQHVDRADLWVNDQPTSKSTCSTTFAYAGWTAKGLASFAAKLKANSIRVAFTVSPAVPTPAYISSLADLWATAKGSSADIEYDLEGAWTRHWGPQGCAGGGGKPDLSAMERQLIDATRAAVPGAEVGVSTTPSHFEDHSTLLRLADWVAPQLYELPPRQMRSDVARLEREYGVRSIWVAVRVDATLETLIPALGTAKAMASTDPIVKGVAIWGRLELTYADKWLRKSE